MVDGDGGGDEWQKQQSAAGEQHISRWMANTSAITIDDFSSVEDEGDINCNNRSFPTPVRSHRSNLVHRHFSTDFLNASSNDASFTAENDLGRE